MIMNLRGAGGKKPVLQSKSVTPGSSDQTVTPDEGYEGMSSVTVSGDSNLVASNIRSGANIFGVSGSLSYKYQSKTVTPSSSSQNVYADSGYTGLFSVTVSGSSSLTASNIKYGVNIFGVTGTYEHTVTGTATLNMSGSLSFTKGSSSAAQTKPDVVDSVSSYTGSTYSYSKGEYSGTGSASKTSTGSVKYSTKALDSSPYYQAMIGGSIGKQVSNTGLPKGDHSATLYYCVPGASKMYNKSVTVSINGSGLATLNTSVNSVNVYTKTGNGSVSLYYYVV